MYGCMSVECVWLYEYGVCMVVSVLSVCGCMSAEYVWLYECGVCMVV